MIKIIKRLCLLPFVALCACQNQTSSFSSPLPILPDVSISVPTSSSPLSSETSLTSSTSLPYEGKTGLDLLYAIFDEYEETRNYTVRQEGVFTDYYFEQAYYRVYSNEMKEVYTVNDHGFIINPIQGIYDFTTDALGSIVVNKLLSTYKTSDYLYDTILNCPGDFAQYCETESCWKVYDPENPPVFEEENVPTVKSFAVDNTSSSEEEPQLPSEKEADKLAKAVFYSTDENAKLIAMTLAGLSFELDENGEYDTSSIDMIKVRINQDYSLTILPTVQNFHPAVYDIVDVNKTKNDTIDNYFSSSEEMYSLPPYGKSVKTEWTITEKGYFKKNFGYELPFPIGASYAFSTYSSTSFAAFTDDACGDITNSYIKQLTDAGFSLLVEDEDARTETSTTYYINTSEDGSTQVRVSFNYSNANPRWEKGTFTANIHKYPYSL